MNNPKSKGDDEIKARITRLEEISSLTLDALEKTGNTVDSMETMLGSLAEHVNQLHREINILKSKNNG